MNSIQELLTQDSNKICADCSSSKVTHVSIKYGTFICSDCAKIHKDVLSAKPESLPCSELAEDTLKEVMGNVVNKNLEENIPPFYNKPTPDSLGWIKEHFIHSKYSKQLFSSTDTLNKSCIGCGKKTGQMHKKGKSKEAWKPRTFVLKDGVLKYFINHNDEHPKSSMDVESIEVKFEDIDNSLVLAITQKKRGDRTLYVLSSTARDTVEWYYCIISSKMGIEADPSQNSTQIANNTLSTHMYKPGPNSNDKWKKRWFSLSNNYITYFSEKLDSHAKGHIEIGSTSDGYNMIEEPVKHGKAAPTEYSFTLVTPSRDYKLCAETPEDLLAWEKAIKRLILAE